MQKKRTADGANARRFNKGDIAIGLYINRKGKSNRNHFPVGNIYKEPNESHYYYMLVN